MRSGLRRSRMHAPRHAASPSFFSTPRNTSTPASDDSWPPSNPTLNFLRATDGRSNGSNVSSFMTGVALLNRSVIRSRNQKQEGQPPVLTPSDPISTLQKQFACARLSRPCPPGSRPDVSATFTTIAFDDRSLRWLGISDLIAEPEGPSFISRIVTHRRLDRRYS